MTEEILPGEPAAPEAPIAPSGAQTPESDLLRRIKVLRRWVIALSVVLALVVVGGCGIIGTTVYTGLYGFSMMSSGEPEDQVAAIKSKIEKAYGDDLADVSVRAVDVDMGMPFFLNGFSGMSEHAYAAEYTLASSDVEFATVLMDESAMGYSGFLPLDGSLASRMSAEQLDGLLKAWDAETDDPFGGVRRYTDSDMAMMEESVSATITLGGKDYPSQRVWVATEGTVVKGDELEYDGMGELDALVFFENPAGEFVFIGREPGMMSLPF